MLFMGEEHGEPAPFQFFSDHIDPRSPRPPARAAEREFAGFAAFTGEEVPDPQDPATFQRSMLTREADPDLSALYRQLLQVRRRCRRATSTRSTFDEEASWLRFRRGPFDIVVSFADAHATVPLPDHVTEVLVSTHHTYAVKDGAIALPALGGALLRGRSG